MSSGGYPGGKAGHGVYQRIINEIPPHERYVEPFAGAGAVLLNMRPSVETVILDLDGAAVMRLRERAIRHGCHVRALEACGIQWLEDHAEQLGAETVVYADPPYVMSTRSRRLYQHELADADHARLLEVLTRLRCPVLLSGYDNLLYRAQLGDWRRIEYLAATRGGPKEEVLWCNFPPARALHDYKHLGETFRERQDMRRMVARWQTKFAGLPVLRRRAILSALMHIETRDPPMTDTQAAEPPMSDSGIGDAAEERFSRTSAGESATADPELALRPPQNGGFPQSGRSSRPRAAIGGTAEAADP